MVEVEEDILEPSAVQTAFVYSANDLRATATQLNAFMGRHLIASAKPELLLSQLHYEGPVAVLVTRRSSQRIPVEWNTRRAASIALHHDVYGCSGPVLRLALYTPSIDAVPLVGCPDLIPAFGRFPSYRLTST